MIGFQDEGIISIGYKDNLCGKNELLNVMFQHLIPPEGARGLKNSLEISVGRKTKEEREPCPYLPESSRPFPKIQVICGGGLLLTVEHLSVTCSFPSGILITEASRVGMEGVAGRELIFLCSMSGSTYPPVKHGI